MAKYGQINNPQGKNQYIGGGGSGQSKPAVTGALSGESFKSAFRKNRDAGAKTFEWQGKLYTTELAPPPKPVVPGRPRGESIGEPARKAPMFARDKDFDRNVVAAAVRNREAAAEVKREARGTMKSATSRWLPGG
jgi:hypothetical protein